jgi:hypothetical protein
VAEDVSAYFGGATMPHGYTPLMPRIYGDRGRTGSRSPTSCGRPPTSENCLKAMFLRNHDELTLEMVDIERVILVDLRQRSARPHQSRHPPPSAR